MKSLELRKLRVEKDLVFNASNIHKSHNLIDLLTLTGSLHSERTGSRAAVVPSPCKLREGIKRA